MGPKHTGDGELWVYIGTPLPNPSGNTGAMVSLYGKLKFFFYLNTLISASSSKPLSLLFEHLYGTVPTFLNKR